MAYQKENFREKYRDLLECSLDLIYIHDLEGNILDANNVALTCFGYNQEDLSNISFIDLIDNEQVVKFFDALKEIKENGKSLEKREYKIKRKDGNYIYLKTYGIPLMKSNEIHAILNTGIDITEHRIKEQKLIESEKKYEHILENANDLIIIINAEFKIEYINERVHNKLLGYSNEELIGKRVLKFIHPDDIKKAVKIARKAMEMGEGKGELRFRSKKGAYIWLEVSGNVFIDSDKYKGLILSRDITERKIAELRLKESEEKYKSIINNLDLGFFKADVNGIFLAHNPALNKILGYAPSESLIGLKTSDNLENPENLKDHFNKLIKEGSVHGFVHRVKKKNGEIVFVQVDSHVIKNKENRVIEIEGTVIDVTEKLNLEQKLKESEEKYRLISENANDMIAVLNTKFEYEYINEDTSFRLMGYKNEDVLGKSALEFIHPKDLTKVASVLNEGVNKGVGNAEYRYKHKNGEWVWLESRGKTFIDNEGNLKGLVISRDITERLKAEQKLIESEEKYRLISENANDLIVVLDDKFKIEYVNEQVVLKLWGYRKEELVGKSALEFIHPDDHKIAIEALKKGFKTGISQSAEVRLKNKMGNWLWFQALGNTYFNTKGELKALIICRDVDEKYKTEQKLRDSERAQKERVKELTCLYGLSKLVENSNLSLKEIIQDTLDLIPRSCQFPDSTCAKITFNTDEFKTSNFKETEYELSMNIKVQTKELNIQLYRLEDKPFLKEEENLIKDIGNRLKSIIEKVRAEENLRQFIALVSHELRNPISVLVQSLNNLEKYKDKISKEMKIKLNGAISRNVKLLFELVEDLLITSRIDEKRVKLIWREYHPYDIIRDLIELMNPIREMKEITLEVNMDKELQLFGDYRRISQIFRILIDNALKYSFEKSKIIINAVDHYKGKYNLQGTDGVLFQFKDFGIGISDEDFPHLFERFFRARNVETISGTGLGLSIAKELTNLHNGEIFVESKHGIGTTFSVFLPRSKKFLEKKINSQLISIK